MGFNRSALMAGLILVHLGACCGEDAVVRLRNCRPGALFNQVFAEYLASLPAAGL
jgi:protein-tyrosine phosphatase